MRDQALSNKNRYQFRVVNVLYEGLYIKAVSRIFIFTLLSEPITILGVREWPFDNSAAFFRRELLYVLNF